MIDMTDQQKAELDALAAISDDEIDSSDIPELRTGLTPNAACITG